MEELRDFGSCVSNPLPIDPVFCIESTQESDLLSTNTKSTDDYLLEEVLASIPKTTDENFCISASKCPENEKQLVGSSSITSNDKLSNDDEVCFPGVVYFVVYFHLLSRLK